MKKIAIVILNWNGANFLNKYLPILVANTPKDIANIYVVDNNSSDDSKAIIEKFESIYWIENNDNYGFAKGYNLGLQNIKEPIYCLLNSDIEVENNYLRYIIEAFEKYPNMAACQPKILSLNQKDSFEYAGGSGGFYDKLGYAVCRGRIFENIEKDLNQYNDEINIFWASGCCLFVKNEIFWEVGGFDSDYFAHQEEIDLCWRINNYGYDIKIIPNSIVYHLGGGSLPYGSYKKLFLNFRNSLFTLFKNLKTYQLFYIIPFRLILDGIASLFYLIKMRNSLGIKSIFFAHIDFYKNIFVLLKKRKEIKYKGYTKTTLNKFVLFEYYCRRKNKFDQL